MKMLDDLRESRDAFRQLGWRNSTLLIGGLVAWLAVGIWLMADAHWPGTCDHSGRKLIGLVKTLWCSPDLLAGGPMEIGLFIWTWSMPVGVGAFTLFTVLKSRSQRAD